MRIWCFYALAGLIFPSAADSHPEQSVYLPKNLYLVRARTAETATREVAGPPPKLRIPEARFEITRVYVGPDRLKDRHFTCDRVPYQISVTSSLDRLHVNVPFEKGAEGLWWVSLDPHGKGTLRPVREAGYVDALGIRPFPYQNLRASRDGQRDFQEGLAWAEAAQKVYQATSDRERRQLLTAYGAEYSPRGAWAISWLGLSGQKDLAGFFRKLLADTRLPIASQVALDRALTAVDADAWSASAERTALYRRWQQTYSPSMLPLPLQVLDAQRMDRREPPLFSLRGIGVPFGQ